MLELSKISKKYGGFRLEEVSFSLPTGYMMGLIGRNGSGKTTLIKLIMNLIREDKGTINIFGRDHRRDEKIIKEDIGFVYDQSCFYENLSMNKMTQIISKFYKNWDDRRYQELMDQFELQPGQRIDTLSKGMKVKYSLAVALSHQAKLLLMDEPTDGLDPVVRRELLKILREELKREEVSILLSTHITSDLDKTADYVTFLDRGKVAVSDSIEAIQERYFLVQAGSSSISPHRYSTFLGYEVNDFRFLGLMEAKEKNKIDSKDWGISTPTLEDLMCFYGRTTDDRTDKKRL